MNRLAKGLAICVLGLALGIQPATAKSPKAGSKATTVASASARGSESTVTATASCPSGMRVTGGGFNAPSSVEVLGLVYESVRVNPRSWRSSAQLLDMGTTSGLTLSTYAYCEKDAPRIKRRRASVATDGVPQLGPTASARCRRGESALAGGFSTPPPLIGQGVSALVLDSHRNGGSAWDTRVATGSAAPSTLTSEAYCARGGASKERSATSPLNTTFFETSSATASCSPSAERTGGFAQPLSVLESFLIIYESRRVDGGWRVSGIHSGANPGVAVSALAYCD